MNVQHTGFNNKETVIGKGNVGSLSQIWDVATGGQILAAPIEQGGYVYALSNDGNLYAVNAITGKTRWTFPATAIDGGNGIAATAKLIYSTCALDSSHSGVCAIDTKSGAIVWSYAIYDGASGPVGSSPYNGPVVDGGTVFFGESDTDSYAHVGYVVALNASTGKQVWGVGNCGDSGFNNCNFVSPAPFAVDKGYIFYDSGAANGPAGEGAALCKRAESNGSLSWCYYNNDAYIAPVISGGKVLFTTTDFNSSTVTLTALDETTGALDWTYTATGNYEFPPAVANGTVFFSNNSNGTGSLYAVSLKTGKSKWSYAAGGAAGDVGSPVSVANGVVYAVCARQAYGVGAQCAFDAETGAVLSTGSTGGGGGVAPLIANGAEITSCNTNDFCRFAP